MQNKKVAIPQIGIFILVFSIIVAIFYFSPLEVSDDWIVFYETVGRLYSGKPLYGDSTRMGYYYNPPWLALLISPLGLSSLRFSWAIISSVNLFIVLLIVWRWKLGVAKLVLILLSPPMIYILLHGQVDILVLAGVLLPREWWLIVGLTKPQVTLGLIFGIRREVLVRAVLMTALIFIVTIGMFGNWPLSLLGQPTPFIYEGHNLWRGFWPYQVTLGVFLILIGIRKRDEKFLLCSSPFLSPYATISNLIGPWIAVSALLKNREVIIIWLSWWAAASYRLLA